MSISLLFVFFLHFSFTHNSKTTVVREIFIVKLFLWEKPTTKIKWTNLYLNELFVCSISMVAMTHENILRQKFHTKKFNMKISQIMAYDACDYYTNQKTVLLLGTLLLWFGGGVWAMTGELWPQNGPSVLRTFLFRHYFGFLSRVLDVVHIVKPHLDNQTRALHAATTLLATNWVYTHVGKSSTTVFFIYLIYLKAV